MLKLKNITKFFPGSSEPVLNGINLELQRGDFCVVIGSNGSGKSTLLRAISGETPCNSGEIHIDGENFSHQDRSHLIASVVQDTNKGTIVEMTLLENMALSAIRGKNATLSLYSRYETEAKALITPLSTGLEHSINKPLKNFSGGQRQMLATLMAINSKPQLLLLDEHTSALDPKMQQRLMDYTTNAIAQHNMTTLMVTHNLDHAIQFGNRLIMMNQGRIVLDVSGDKKSKLNIIEILALYHQHDNPHLSSALGGVL